MSVFVIKLAAMLAMLIDHCAYVLDPPHYFLLRCIGRIAFPLYCFLIVNGLEHTHDRRRYLARLLIFAAISQLPFAMAFYPGESGTGSGTHSPPSHCSTLSPFCRTLTMASAARR